MGAASEVATLTRVVATSTKEVAVTIIANREETLTREALEASAVTKATSVVTKVVTGATSAARRMMVSVVTGNVGPDTTKEGTLAAVTSVETDEEETSITIRADCVCEKVRILCEEQTKTMC